MSDVQELTLEEAKALIQKQTRRKPAKYRNKKTPYGGRVYDSAREARHAMELDVRLKAGEFLSWEPQVPFDLIANGCVIGKYVADFLLWYPGAFGGTSRSPVIEEVKGHETPLWRWKRRHLQAQHSNIELRVIR